jgi:hypothetical protein
MKKTAARNSGTVKIRSVVHIGISEFDNTKVDPPNLTCVVVDQCANGTFRLACKRGVLNTTYTTNRMTLLHCDMGLMGLENVYQQWAGMEKISKREAARALSIIGGQGFVKCTCKGKCLTNSCTCKRLGRICNSRCHKGNNNCCNHDECAT